MNHRAGAGPIILAVIADVAVGCLQLCVCLLQSATRRRVRDYERGESATARLLKAESERSKVGKTTFLCLVIFCTQRFCMNQKSLETIDSFTLKTTASTFLSIFLTMRLLSCPLQADRELERARRLLEQSEDSRQSLVQQVCHFAAFG